jgi:triosephosphate isomerase
MNLLTKDALELSSSINNYLKEGHSKCKVVICPPFTLLSNVAHHIKDAKFLLGAQDCSSWEQGAYTGDISADMLQDLQCKYVILGHSERRLKYSQESQLIKEKASKVYKYKMTPIVCVGESILERDSNKTKDVLIKQVLESIPYIHQDQELIVAYEPVWAIGSGLKLPESEIEKVAAFLSDFIHSKFMFTRRVKILYGGSVNENNCHDIFNLDSISGLLVGGASLKTKSFIDIIRNCKEV